MPYSVDHSQFEPQKTRPRESSSVRGGANSPDYVRFNQPQQPPISEAVSSALDKADTPNYVPPELIAQITENVIKQLKTSRLDGGTPVPQTSKPFPAPPPPIQQPIPLSPSTASASSPPIQRSMYTPPSPHKHQDYRRESPEFRSAVPQCEPRSPRASPKSQFKERRTSSPYSDSNESGYTRPKGPTRLCTGRDETTLEKIWGQLFDEESNPTVRLGQFLRGLAVHIIEDYEPCHSIVITPAKMIKYYEDVKLPNEIYPWSIVFDDDKSQISRLYRELSCQHHLVQDRLDEKPDIPGLTPIGFQRWVTLLIIAHPDEEYERLQKAVLDMPISNPDEKKERFPKEISRRLFPSTGDRKVCERLDDAIAEHAKVDLPKRSRHDESPTSTPTVTTDTTPVPQAHRREPSISVETKNLAPSALERERAPYSNTPSEAIIDDTNPFPPPSQPIERERKPYSAVPGGGKAFDDDARAGKPRPESAASKIGRSNSTAQPRPIPPSANGPRPMEMPKPEIHNHLHNTSNVRRQRSPSFSRANNDFRRSESDIRGYPTPFQGSSGPPAEIIDDDGRRYARERADRARRQADEDARGYGESPSSRTRYDRGPDLNGPHRGSYVNEEEYYRSAGRGGPGNGYDYSQQAYGGQMYR